MGRTFGLTFWAALMEGLRYETRYIRNMDSYILHPFLPAPEFENIGWTAYVLEMNFGLMRRDLARRCVTLVASVIKVHRFHYSFYYAERQRNSTSSKKLNCFRSCTRWGLNNIDSFSCMHNNICTINAHTTRKYLNITYNHIYKWSVCIERYRGRLTFWRLQFYVRYYGGYMLKIIYT